MDLPILAGNSFHDHISPSLYLRKREVSLLVQGIWTKAVVKNRVPNPLDQKPPPCSVHVERSSSLVDRQLAGVGTATTCAVDPFA